MMAKENGGIPDDKDEFNCQKASHAEKIYFPAIKVTPPSHIGDHWRRSSHR